MVNPQGKYGRKGSIPAAGVYGVDLDEQRWFPVQYLSGGLVVAGSKGVIYQDDVDRALVMMELDHHKIHEGEMYEVFYYDAALADSGTIILSTPDPIGAEVHFSFDGECGGDATMELIEGATPTGGAAQTAFNMNRNYADSALAPLLNPALAGGTVLTEILLPGGTKNQAAGASGTSRGAEWITDPTEPYAVRLTNISGAVKPASLHINFYTP